MKLWRITSFDDGPHWDTAMVWAESADEARSILTAKLGIGTDEHPDTVWAPEEDAGGKSGWRVSEVNPDGGRVAFLLGSGCR